MSRPRQAPAVLFGWAYDHGEFAVVADESSPLVRLILDHCGFEHRIEELDAWGIEPGADDRDQQTTAAGVAVELLAVAGLRVGNWHEPQQGTADVVRHYRWLRSTDPFPDAAAVERAAAAEAWERLSTRELDPVSRQTTEEVASGLLRVEARRTLDGTEWMLATPQGEPDHYVGLRHDLKDGRFGITDDYATWFAGQARRDFRIDILRETRPPKSARACAAALAGAPVRLSAGLADRPVHPAVAALEARHR
ncbi:hypothetical protein ACFVUH_08475 [Kitasatospora sp. NPDC058032]|uniref:hypothetical protein n=1 Tax=Kitasatospora sp. NPDC058032 TaxID=3346307 RepID=UPI0036D80408